MQNMTYDLAPKQIIQVTERLGFFETAEAMKQTMGSFCGEAVREMPAVADRTFRPVPIASRIKFMRFRRRFNPFG